ISNAIKYTQNGGKVRVLTRVREGGVEIVVADNGIGIPVEDLPHVFDRFFQVDKARGPKRGTGLGLAITREIVLAHGGTIDVRSPGVNQGTTVTVWLPSPQLSTVVSQRV
ncbi:MAG: cell wall metabolism sensor histidine kinase WalK, partial [Anaerolineae bacterium]|nr:cell wall metabolism sensor histidine kinase WalK [Anaerolineae bacterium]